MKTQFKVAIGCAVAVLLAVPSGVAVRNALAGTDGSAIVTATGEAVRSPDAPSGTATSATSATSASTSPSPSTSEPAETGILEALPGIGSAAGPWRQQHTPLKGYPAGSAYGPDPDGGTTTYLNVTSASVAGRDRIVSYKRVFPAGTSLTETMDLIHADLPADMETVPKVTGPYCMMFEVASPSLSKELPGQSVYMILHTTVKAALVSSKILDARFTIASAGATTACAQLPPTSS